MSGLWSALEPVDIGAQTCWAWRVETDARDNRLDLSDGLYRHPEYDQIEALVVSQARLHVAERAVPVTPSLCGHPAFQAALARVALRQDEPEERQTMVATSGGHTAVRLALELTARAGSAATVHVPDTPSEELREAARAAGLTLRSYRYATNDGTALAPEQMLSDLRRCRAGDLVLVQGCCHNPTGHDLPEALWAALAAVLLETGAVPLVTLDGLGLGLEPDKESDGVHSLLIALPEVMVTIDCAATFAMGADAPGLLVVQAAEAAEAGMVTNHLEHLTAGLTGRPPHEGPALVSEILHRALLTEEWTRVLRRGRQHLAGLRADLAAALRDATGQDNWDHIATGRGPYLRLPLSPEQVESLAEEHAIYLRSDARANLSALPQSEISRLAEATAQCLGLAAKPAEPQPEQKEADTTAASERGGESKEVAEPETGPETGPKTGPKTGPEAAPSEEAEQGDDTAETTEDATDGASDGADEGAEPTQAA